MNHQNLVGGAWLEAQFGIELVVPLAMRSEIGSRRSSKALEGISLEIYPRSEEHTSELQSD